MNTATSSASDAATLRRPRRALSQVRVPMLFLQGTRDALADMRRLLSLFAGLGELATLVTADDADHAFHVQVRSGKTDAKVLTKLLAALADWATVVQPASSLAEP